ncbi:hypothetical protein ACJX0J_005491, partial [Zea mays]
MQVLVKNNRPCPGLPGKPVHGVAPFPASNSGSPSPDAISTLRQRFGNRADPDHQRLGWRGFLHAAQIQAIPRLAEFFHDLHEEVMATASRGHGLLIRLQQLEAEFSMVEKAIVSQTGHSNYPHDD